MTGGFFVKKIIFLLYTFLLVSQSPMKELPNHELILLAQSGQEEGWELKDWQVVSINIISKNEFDNISNSLQNSYFVSISKDQNAVKYKFESKNKNDLINHSFQAVVPQNNSDRVTLKTVISGAEWNEKIYDYYSRLTRDLQSDYKIKFTRNFTCLKFDVGGIINSGSLFDEFWNKMKVVHKKEQYDNVQQSIYEKEIYGYSPLLGEEINVNNEKINFQIALKNVTANKTELIVGTPMIINEY